MDANTTLSPAAFRAAVLTLVMTAFKIERYSYVDGAFVPWIGLVTKADFLNAVQAAAQHYEAGHRIRAMRAMVDTLTPGWQTFRNGEAKDRARRDGMLLLKWIEQHAPTA